MVLPLPQVVADVGPGGSLATALRGWNDVTVGNAKAKYAPYTEYSNALSKMAYANMLPYQIKAQLMSNPMVWMALKDNPEAIHSFVNSFSNSIPQGNNVTGNINIPQPNSNQFGGNPFSNLFGTLINKITGNKQQDQNQQQSQNNSNIPSSDGNIPSNQGQNIPFQNNDNSNNSNIDSSPLFPSSSGMTSVGERMTAPYSEQIHKESVLFRDPLTGKIISTPSSATVTSLQSAINAAQRAEPQLKKLADAASPFMTASGQGNLLLQRGKNFFQYGKEPGKLPTQYAAFKSLIQSAPESLVKAYGLRPTNETIGRMQKIIEPLIGETSDQYKQRLLNQLESLKKEQVGISQKQLSHGFETDNTDEKNFPETVTENSPSKGAKILSKRMIMPHFNSREEGVAWFNRQPKVTQDAIRQYLGTK